jgi:uncharacterized protein (DUF1330 family)
MQYLIAGEGTPLRELDALGCRLVANGGAVVMEPWPPGKTALYQLRRDSGLDAVKATAAGAGGVAFAIEGLDDPGAGQAYVIAAHRIREAARFRAYADRVGAVVQQFKGRFLARGGNLVQIAGDFSPDRGVVLEFPTAADAVAFYVADIYAPLLKLRLQTVDPGFVIVARSGELPADARRVAEDYLRARADGPRPASGG